MGGLRGLRSTLESPLLSLDARRAQGSEPGSGRFDPRTVPVRTAVEDFNPDFDPAGDLDPSVGRAFWTGIRAGRSADALKRPSQEANHPFCVERFALDVQSGLIVCEGPIATALTQVQRPGVRHPV